MGDYLPTAEHWERIDPAQAGFDPARLQDAFRYALQSECPWPRSLYREDGRYVGTAEVDDRPPYDGVLGIVRERGGANGMVLKGGRLVAEFGDVQRADTTFSAAKSYLALLAGIAVDDGLIASIDDPIAAARLDDGFDSPHNRSITWRHLLNQTSEWEGTLWDRPDSVDHRRQAGVTHDNRDKGRPRERQAPGTHWEYNDVRVNRLALSLTRLFRRPLPEVLRERIMDPIGASSRWEWHGYANSAIDIDGRPVVSVSGGGHWGGGLFIPTRDHARVGLLVQRRGRWGDRQLLSERWLSWMLEPTPLNPQYGAMWWLNTNRGLYPAAPADSVFAIGGGQHLVWVDNAHDLVVVMRWIAREHCNELIERLMAALN